MHIDQSWTSFIDSETKSTLCGRHVAADSAATAAALRALNRPAADEVLCAECMAIQVDRRLTTLGPPDPPKQPPGRKHG